MKMTKILSFPKLLLSIIAVITLSWIPVNQFDSFPTEEIKVAESSELDPLIVLEQEAVSIYDSVNLAQVGLPFDVFEKAFIGFLNLRDAGKLSTSSNILTVADFNQSSKNKRLWIIDLDKQELLLNTWVSHGRGSGGERATKFSNVTNSHQSSLGFYITGEVYYGKHGRSLRLDGLDVGFNHKARERAIVLHGASYVSAAAIKSLNRLGLSHGCPAVPVELTNQIIDLIKAKNVLYIHADSPTYESEYLNTEMAAKRLALSVDKRSGSAI